MTIVDQKLAELALKISGLPEAAQVDILNEISVRLDTLACPQMSIAQRAIVSDRMSKPREYASEVEVAALLRRFGAGA